MDIYPFPNKRAMVFNMSHGDVGYQLLLDGLSTKEILILKKHPDLISWVQEITRMTTVQIIAELQDGFNLEVDEYPTGDLWVNTEKLESFIPDWFTTSHCGWYKDARNGEFEEWAKNFLMQEVRINIWLRYLEHKEDENDTVGHYGLYL